MMLSSSKQSSTCNQDRGFKKLGQWMSAFANPKHNSKNAKKIRDYMFHVQIIDDPLIKRWNINLQLKASRDSPQLQSTCAEDLGNILLPTLRTNSKNAKQMGLDYSRFTCKSWMTYSSERWKIG